MSQRPNTLAIGSFFAFALVLLVATLFFFGGTDMFRKKERFVMFFEGSITGLKVGAPVTFQGVQIGQVANISLTMNSQTGDLIIPVYVDIDRETFEQFTSEEGKLREDLIKRGLRAQLKIQSLLTSLLYIELDFSPEHPLRYIGSDSDYPELPTIPTPFQELTKDLNELNIEQLVQRIQLAADGIEKLVNSEDTRGSISALHSLLKHTDEAVLRIDQELTPAIAELRKAARSIDAAASQVNAATPELNAELKATLQSARDSLARIDEATANIGFVFSEDSALYQEFVQAAEDVSDAARSVRQTSDTIDQQPEALLRGKQVTEE